MVTTPDTFSDPRLPDTSSTDRRSTLHTLRRALSFLRLSLVIICIGTGLLATTGWILGVYELITPAHIAASLRLSVAATFGWLLLVVLLIWPLVSIRRGLVLLFCTFLCLGGLFFIWRVLAWETRSYLFAVPSKSIFPVLLTVAVCLGWLLVVWLAVRRQASVKACVTMFLGTAICWGGLLGASQVFFYQPLAKLYDIDWRPATDAEVRSVCHRCFVCDAIDPHDPFIYITGCGDEFSLPYLLWSLRRVPPKERGVCTWVHGFDALRKITNHSAGSTTEAWNQWYAANKNLSQREWWASGFVAEGYPVSVNGGDESIRSLLRAMGLTSWYQPSDKWWLAGNAKRMLATIDEKPIKRMIAEIMKNGSMQERRGVARYLAYAEKPDRDYSEPILRELMRSDRRELRLWTSGMLSRLQSQWLKNPAGFIKKRFEPGAFSDKEFFSPADAKVMKPIVGTHADTYDRETETYRSTIPVIPAEGGAQTVDPTCVIKINWEKIPSDSSLEYATALAVQGVSTSGKAVYSTKIAEGPTDVNELRWLYDPVEDCVYLSLPAYTGKIDRKSGRLIWEIGIGTGNCDDVLLIGGYLILSVDGDFLLYDASCGEMLANYNIPKRWFNRDQITLVNGQLRVKDSEDVLYQLALPQRPL